VSDLKIKVHWAVVVSGVAETDEHEYSEMSMFGVHQLPEEIVKLLRVWVVDHLQKAFYRDKQLQPEIQTEDDLERLQELRDAAAEHLRLAQKSGVDYVIPPTESVDLRLDASAVPAPSRSKRLD
jgi:hypothetical protein